MRRSDIKLDEVGAVVRRGWHWWTSELGALAPNWFLDRWTTVRCFFLDLDSQIIVREGEGAGAIELARFDEGTLSEASDSAQPSSFPFGAGNTAVVRVPESVSLMRRLVLPTASTKDLRRLLQLELERQSPIAMENLEFDFKVVSKDKARKKLHIDLYVIERDTVERCRRICRALGLRPNAIRLMNEPAQSSNWRFRLSPPLTLPPLFARYNLLALALLTAALGVATLIVGYTHDLRVAKELQTKVREARSSAESANRLRAQLDVASRDLTFLSDQQRSPHAAEMIAEVTRLLPDNAWLFSLELKGSDGRIRGFSSDAGSLIKLFDRSHVFSNARFDAPFMQAPTGLQRFDLAFKIKGASG